MVRIEANCISVSDFNFLSGATVNKVDVFVDDVVIDAITVYTTNGSFTIKSERNEFGDSWQEVYISDWTKDDES